MHYIYMEMSATETTYYRQRLETLSTEKKKVHRSIFHLGMLRLFCFLAAAFFLYFFPFLGIGGIALLIFGASFLFFVAKSADLTVTKRKIAFMQTLNEREIAVSDGDWSAFVDGQKYAEAEHPFSSDLDILGKGSFFQLLNRTTHPLSEELLARTLLHGCENRDVSKEALHHIVHKPDWCQEYLSVAGSEKTENLSIRISDKLNIPFLRNYYVKNYEWLVTIPTCLILLTWYAGFVSHVPLFCLLAASISLSFLKMKDVNNLCRTLEGLEDSVRVQFNQLLAIEKIECSAGLFYDYKKELLGNDSSFRSGLQELIRIQRMSSYRNNVLVGLLLNGFLGWDARVVRAYQNWRLDNEVNWQQKERMLAMMEVWISGAQYWRHFPEATFASSCEENSLNVEELAHPFIKKEKCVSNSLKYAKGEKLMVVTGPNMAGKSTFLRSIGLLFVSSNAGFPVLASSCQLPNRALFTSMRSTDDLNESSSYFHAELSRLRKLMDTMSGEKKVFVILDEILKGTNSKDKEQGSLLFLKKIAEKDAMGLVATHDLALCDLEKESKVFRNIFFDSVIQGDELFFDYRLRNGICQNMNAVFLLKKMGLID